MTSNSDSTPAVHRCWAEVDLDALRHNLAAMRAQVPHAEILAVIKANAYGHGVANVARTIAPHVKMLGVANLVEAKAVRASLEGTPEAGTPVLLLGATLPQERSEVVAVGFHAQISNYEEAQDYSRHGSALLHLVIDTGMGRMGVPESGAVDLAERIRALPGITLAGVSSHLPVADEDDVYTTDQLKRFHEIAQSIASRFSPAPVIHVENSAGAIGFPAHAGDLIRMGLSLYGVSPRPEFQSKLRPVLAWKTRVLLARDVPAGTGISYGRTYITERPTRVATLAAGYADGYPRQVSGRGAYVLVQGQPCAVLGRVTMDQIMVDVTNVPGIQPGDEVTLLGRDGSHEISASMIAAWAGTIPWDVFTGIGQRVVRVPHAKSAPFQTEKAH